MTNSEKFFQQFENWVLWDIRYLLKLEDESGNRLLSDRTTDKYRRRPFVASAILICCAIDVLAGLRYGKTSDANSGEYFKRFIEEYFVSQNTNSGKSYNGTYICKGLRNALIHGYTLLNDLGLAHEDKDLHLKQQGNVLLIDVFSLYFDLESVYKIYKNELLAGEHSEEFNKRWAVAPMVEFIPTENIKR